MIIMEGLSTLSLSILCFAFVSVDATISPGAICYKRHEVFSPCDGHCDKTCTNPNPVCARICRPGCICKEGYLRDTVTGECVPPRSCPSDKICNGENEEYTECGARCEKTCIKPNPLVCPAICQSGCVCKEGYLRDTVTKTCVPPTDCSPNQICPGEHEVFSQCGGHCEKTCVNPNPICTYMCQPGCVCKDGYLRDTVAGQCVPYGMCSPNQVCPKANEVFSTCNGHCDKTCDNPDPVCTRKCQPGCVCMPGFLRDATAGECVEPDQCQT